MFQSELRVEIRVDVNMASTKRIPQAVSLVSSLFLADIFVQHGSMDLLGASWECESISRAGRQQGAMDPRFQNFYDMVRIINFF